MLMVHAVIVRFMWLRWVQFRSTWLGAWIKSHSWGGWHHHIILCGLWSVVAVAAAVVAVAAVVVVVVVVAVVVPFRQGR